VNAGGFQCAVRRIGAGTQRSCNLTRRALGSEEVARSGGAAFSDAVGCDNERLSRVETEDGIAGIESKRDSKHRRRRHKLSDSAVITERERALMTGGCINDGPRYRVHDGHERDRVGVFVVDRSQPLVRAAERRGRRPIAPE
jgi:hypothetical protein